QADEAQVVQARLDQEFADPFAQQPLDLGFLVGGGSIGEGESGQIARQPNAAGDDNVGLRAGATQPFATGMTQAIQIHPWLPLFESSLVSGRLLRTVRLRPPDVIAGAGQSLPSGSGRGGAASCPHACWRGESAATRAPGRCGTPRNLADNPAGP